MPKILAQAGISLADVYDVEGSIAGTDELLSKDVSLIHEMGAQIHSERLTAFIITMTSGDVAASTDFGVQAAGIPDSMNRVLGVQVLVDTTGGADFVQVSLESLVPVQEFPIFIWDSADDAEQRILYDLNGAGAADFFALRPQAPTAPTLLGRFGDAKLMGDLIFRGTTSAFGGGTVVVRALIHLLRPDIGNPPAAEPSSHGLPLPSW